MFHIEDFATLVLKTSIALIAMEDGVGAGTERRQMAKPLLEVSSRVIKKGGPQGNDLMATR